MNLTDLRNKAKNLQPSVRIGKYGINQATINEIKRQLEHKKLVKIKFLKNTDLEPKKIAEEITKKTNSRLIDAVGRVIVLYKG